MGAAPPFDGSTSLSRHRAASRAMQPGPWDAEAGDLQPSTANAPSTSCGAYRMKMDQLEAAERAATSQLELMAARSPHT